MGGPRKGPLMHSTAQPSVLKPGTKGWPGFWGESWTRNQDICSLTTFHTTSPCPFLPRLLKQLPDACPPHPCPYPIFQLHTCSHITQPRTFQSYNVVLLLPFIKSSVIPQCPGVKVLPPYLAYPAFHIPTTQILLFFFHIPFCLLHSQQTCLRFFKHWFETYEIADI